MVMNCITIDTVLNYLKRYTKPHNNNMVVVGTMYSFIYFICYVPTAFENLQPFSLTTCRPLSLSELHTGEWAEWGFQKR